MKTSIRSREIVIHAGLHAISFSVDSAPSSCEFTINSIWCLVNTYNHRHYRVKAKSTRFLCLIDITDSTVQLPMWYSKTNTLVKALVPPTSHCSELYPYGETFASYNARSLAQELASGNDSLY